MIFFPLAAWGGQGLLVTKNIIIIIISGTPFNAYYSCFITSTDGLFVGFCFVFRLGVLLLMSYGMKREVLSHLNL